MSPRARTGLFAAAIVGGAFMLCGGALGIFMVARPGVKAGPGAPPSAPGRPLADGRKVAITGVVRAVTPANEGIEWMIQNGMAASEQPVLREAARERPPVRSFPYAVIVMTRDGEYTCLFPPCTSEEFMKKSAQLEGRRVEVIGRKITDVGVCHELVDCQITLAILP